jgi:hypothetical protein
MMPRSFFEGHCVAARFQLPVSRAQAGLCPPCKVLNDLRGALGAALNHVGLSGGVAISPSRFDEQPANMTIAGLGDATARLFRSARVFIGDDAEISLELWGARKNALNRRSQPRP